MKKAPFFKKHDHSKLHQELNLYLEWYLKLNKTENNKDIKEWKKIWNDLFDKFNNTNSCIVLRDFHVDNIFYLNERINERKIGLIDYQDSLVGSSAYDLVSLLQDVRIFLSYSEQVKLYNYFIKRSKVNKNDFEYIYLVLGTQRLFKILGIFKKLSIKQKKIKYLKYLPRTKKLLKKNLSNSIFDQLNNWLKSLIFMNNKKLSKVIETIILCAGRGKRMRYKTNYSAKPLIKIRNKPILEINLNYLYKAESKIVLQQ